MPQFPRKTRQMIPVVGIKPPVYADRLYTVAGNVATLVGKTQYISKGVGGTWPGPGWHAGTLVGDNTPVDDIEIETLPAGENLF
jgi:hypothetical protein